jgi:hypothetical protein
MMGKKKKEDDLERDWRCGDCGAWNKYETRFCKAPQHDFAERALRAEFALKQLSDERIDKDYLTPNEFVEDLVPMLKDYLVKTYGDEKSHPHDLATAAASFMDAYWIISDHRGI